MQYEALMLSVPDLGQYHVLMWLLLLRPLEASKIKLAQSEKGKFYYTTKKIKNYFKLKEFDTHEN